MLKKLRHQLLKINWLRLKVEAYQLRQKDKQWHEDWARKMRSSGVVREDEVLVDYSDTRMIGQRHVAPRMIRPFGLGRGKD